MEPIGSFPPANLPLKPLEVGRNLPVNFKNPNHEALGEEAVDAPFVKTEKSCAVCGRIGCKFYMCSCKGLNAYCSRACQGIAWPSHKILCTFKKVSLS